MGRVTMLSLIQLVLFHCKHSHAAELPQWVYRADVCPNSTDINKWIEASKELNCYHNLTSNDPTEQKRVYHCLPTSFLNETVEFCSQSVLIESGNCPVYSFSSDKVIESLPCICIHLISECPKETFYSKEVYKFPYCLELRNKSNCLEVIRNPANPPEGRDSDNALDTLVIVLITLGSIFSVGLVIVFICWFKYNYFQN